MSTILGFDTYDFRFPTSTDLDGSDAMNPSPDYPAAYAVIRTHARGRPGRQRGPAVWPRLRVHDRPRERCPTGGDPRAGAARRRAGRGGVPGRPRRVVPAADRGKRTALARPGRPASRSGCCSPSSRRKRSSASSTSRVAGLPVTSRRSAGAWADGPRDRASHPSAAL